MRGATVEKGASSTNTDISIHAPLAGCDVTQEETFTLPENISIHAPLAGCDCNGTRDARSPCGISIHAPLAGCDVFLPSGCSRFYHFNPRTPCGVRHSRRMDRHCKSEFQSTHPLRGATTYTGTFSGPASNFNPRTPCGVRPHRVLRPTRNFLISIHAPLAGCDSRMMSSITSGMPFQSTHPLRGATLKGKRFVTMAEFQSTHPLRGATTVKHGKIPLDDISIHAPLAGCDGAAGPHEPNRLDFNPRTPCGVRRHCRRDGQRAAGHFNPRTPCGVRHCLRQCCNRRCSFQSTHPLRGATRDDGPAVSLRVISIHAPLAGCDAEQPRLSLGLEHFNPRTPCGVRQHPRKTRQDVFLISIHAPLAGCDKGGQP